MKLHNSKRWQMQDAKAKLSRVVKESQSKGPQIITVHGEDVAAVVAIGDLPYVISSSAKKQKKGEILKMLLRCPHPLSDSDFRRDQTPISGGSIFE